MDNINHHKQNNFKILNALFEVIRHDEKTMPGNYPVLQDTELGWVISDKIPLAAPEYTPKQSYLICNNSLDQQLRRFLETEDMNILRNFVRRTVQEAYHTRYAECFIDLLNTRVKATWNSVQIGKVMVSSARVTFSEKLDLHQAYSGFVQEYEELCHMNQINEDTSSAEEKLLPSKSSGFQEFQQYCTHLCCLTSASITCE
jgi:hypothetical protein